MSPVGQHSRRSIGQEGKVSLEVLGQYMATRDQEVTAASRAMESDRRPRSIPRCFRDGR